MAVTLGIDVSTYQPKTPSLRGLDFLFARASIATTPDEMYRRHSTVARKSGLVVGAYHFGISSTPIADQVATFLHAAPTADLYAIDVEGPQALSKSQTRDFIARVKATGRVCGLYHSQSGFFKAGQDFDWVANWSRVPARHWDFWQYRGSPLDLDEYNGSRAQLNALAGLSILVWGPDVPASIRGFGVNTVAKAIKDTGVAEVHWTGVINLGDIAAALDKIGHPYGKVIDPSDVQVLVDH